MKNTIFILIIISFVFSDQFAWVSKDESNKAKDLIANSDNLYFYCAPCENDIPKLVTVKSIAVSKVKHKWLFGFPSFRKLCYNLESTFKKHYELKINNEGHDLAYIYYYNKDGKWENVASKLNLNPKEVPLFITPNPK
tara:strand:+ start:652 stop:1065 length:414 start_codon:yes stop_codon:yes gene_type:complete